MLTLIKIILFGGSTLLTPNPIDIGHEPIQIAFEKPLKVITKGASINIDVSPYITANNVFDGFKEIESSFPEGCVIAVLESVDGKKIVLSKSSARWGGDNKMLNLKSNIGVPTGVKFVGIQISSCKAISDTNVTWYNYSK